MKHVWTLIVKYVLVLFQFGVPFFTVPKHMFLFFFCSKGNHFSSMFLFRRGTFLFYVSFLFRRGMFLFYLEEGCFSSVNLKLNQWENFSSSTPLFSLGDPEKGWYTGTLDTCKNFNITHVVYNFVAFNRERPKTTHKLYG